MRQVCDQRGAKADGRKREVSNDDKSGGKCSFVKEKEEAEEEVRRALQAVQTEGAKSPVQRETNTVDMRVSNTSCEINRVSQIEKNGRTRSEVHYKRKKSNNAGSQGKSARGEKQNSPREPNRRI